MSNVKTSHKPQNPSIFIVSETDLRVSTFFLPNGNDENAQITIF